MHQIPNGLVKDTNQGLKDLHQLCHPGGPTKQDSLEAQAELNMRFSSMPQYMCPETGHRVKVFKSGSVLTLKFMTAQEQLHLLWNWR